MKTTIDWLFLILAGLCEVGWAVSLKYSETFTKFWASCGVFVGMVLSVSFLALAARTIPIGTSYAIWTGIGSTGTAVCGILFFGESDNFWRLFFLGVIIFGIAGLYAASAK